MTKEVIQEAQVVNLFMVYQFLKRLATPFSQWPAFAEGVIDERGNILIPIKKRNTVRQRNAFGKFDLLVLKLKKLLEKVPGGKSRLASYAAALYLIKEDWKSYNEEIIENDNRVDKEFVGLLEEVTNSAGSGNIAGFGVNGKDDVKVTKKKAKKYKDSNKEEAPRKIIGFEEFKRIRQEAADAEKR